MITNHVKTLSRPSATILRTAARLTLGLVAEFFILLITLHFLEPEFDPSWHWISEYELGRYGWMMSLAFFLWGGGALALLVTIWHSLPTTGGHIGRWWLLLIAIALLGAGVFITDPITDTTPSPAGVLHSLCGMFTILTFPIMATLLARSLVRNPEWGSVKPLLSWITLLTWVGELAFWGSIIASSAIHHATGMGPQILAGWSNRFMVATYGIWLMAVAWYARKVEGQTNKVSLVHV